jgi:hypothetical protein
MKYIFGPVHKSQQKGAKLFLVIVTGKRLNISRNYFFMVEKHESIALEFVDTKSDSIPFFVHFWLKFFSLRLTLHFLFSDSLSM